METPSTTDSSSDIASAPALECPIRRKVVIATGVIWRERNWPSDPSTYDVEMSSRRVRVRHDRGPWHSVTWPVIIENSSDRGKRKPGGHGVRFQHNGTWRFIPWPELLAVTAVESK